jgi:hypothetical protein
MPRFRFSSLTALASLGLVVSCVTEVPMDPEPPVQADCVPTETYFQDEVWNTFMGNTCFACHNPQGVAGQTDLVLVGSAVANYLDTNLATVADVAALERDGTSIMLLKPSAEVEHGGGLIFERGSPEYVALEGLVERLKNPVACEVVESDDFFNDVETLDNGATLRKATLSLAGRLPTDEELAQVEDGDVEDLDAVLDSLLEEDAFYDRLIEMYNDKFLTDRYLRNDDGVNLLDTDDFPDARYYMDLDPEVDDPTFVELADDYTNDSVARAPLQLIAYIVKNDRPFHEIVTANYMMVNPFSARTYGVFEQVAWNDELDPNEWHQAQLPGIPHAGVLTDPMWLNRFPTTETNRNRHRSRMTFDFFMAQDVMRLAERPVDPTSISGHNPEMNNPQCNVCHANIDPVAGAFQNWDAAGRYRPPEEGWYPEMRPPGLGEALVPQGEYATSIQWLAEQIAANELFDLSIVHTAWQGLTGQKPILPPGEDTTEEEFAGQTAAFQQQDTEFKRVASLFRASDHNYKVLIKELIKSPWYRIASLRRDAEGDRAFELAKVGAPRFLTPEMLHRKVEAVLGTTWTSPFDANRNYLLRNDEYRIFYGGIDSDGVTTRITDPNGLMSSVAARMANEMTCRVVARDFVGPMQSRRLFPHVERTFEPFDVNGFEVAGAVDAIHRNIQHLHRHILGEDLDMNHPEIERTYTLFVETLQEGQAKREADEVGRDLDFNCRATTDQLTGDPLPEELRVQNDDRYVIRAWWAVLTYLLNDYKFLHE